MACRCVGGNVQLPEVASEGIVARCFHLCQQDVQRFDADQTRWLDSPIAGPSWGYCHRCHQPTRLFRSCLAAARKV